MRYLGGGIPRGDAAGAHGVVVAQEVEQCCLLALLGARVPVQVDVIPDAVDLHEVPIRALAFRRAGVAEHQAVDAELVEHELVGVGETLAHGVAFHKAPVGAEERGGAARYAQAAGLQGLCCGERHLFVADRAAGPHLGDDLVNCRVHALGVAGLQVLVDEVVQLKTGERACVVVIGVVEVVVLDAAHVVEFGVLQQQVIGRQNVADGEALVGEAVDLAREIPGGLREQIECFGLGGGELGIRPAGSGCRALFARFGLHAGGCGRLVDRAVA